MAFVSVSELREQLNFTSDQGAIDEDLLQRKLDAALDHVQRLLGFKIEDNYGGEDQEEVPASLIEAIYQLAAHWYENREATIIGVSGQELPFGVRQIINEYRDWSF